MRGRKMSEKRLKEKTASGLLWGAVNNLSTQVLMALIGIVLGRLLSPGEYGIVGMLAIFTAIAGSLQESGFTAALTNLKQATHREYNAVFWFSTIVSLSLYIVLYLSAPLIARFFHQPELISLSRLVFASFVVAGIGTAHSAYMFRNMLNREKAVINIIALLGSGTVGITLALRGYSYWSLAWQQFTYICIIDLGRIHYVRWLPSLHIDLTPIREMFGFSSKLLITNIINQVNQNLLSFIFGRLLTAQAVGSYTQASKWNAMGHSFISNTIQQVAQPILASVNEEGQRQLNVFRKLLRFTAFLSMPIMFGLALVSEFVVVLLGDQWSESVTLLRILCIGGAFLPLQTLYQNLFISHGLSNVYMWLTIAQIITILCSIIVCSQWGILYMVAAYSAISIIWLGIWQILAHQFMGLRHFDIIKDITPFFLIAFACATIAYMLSQNIHSVIPCIATKIIIMGLLYICIMKLTHAKIFEECVNYFLVRIKPRQ